MKKNSNIVVVLILFLLKFFGFYVLSKGFVDYILLFILFLMIIPIKRISLYGTLICLYVGFLTLSSIYSMLFNGQNLILVILRSYNYYAILLFFFLLKRNYSSSFTIDVLKKTALIFCIGYILQWIVYPTIIFSGVVDENAVNMDQYRARMPGSICSYFILMYGLNTFLIKKKMISFLYIIMGFIPIIIMGFRSLTFLTIVAIGLMIPFVVRNFRKILLYELVGLAFGIFMMSTSLVVNKIDEMMKRQDSSQTFENEDYIRYLSLDYFWNYQFVKPYEKVIGGGLPFDMSSKYSKKISDSASYNGLYWVDLGLVGLSMIIGIPSVLSLIALYLICMWKCREPELQYIRFTLFIVLFGSIFTSMELFRNGNLLLFSLILYIEFKYHREQIIAKTVSCCKK